ncbi:MAG: hypothetical protein ABSG53_07555, partial [Thermoguttaceae bacterium]
ASQHAGAQQLFSQQGWQQASLALSRSKRWGRQLFGTQPQAGSQHLGASQAGAQGFGASQAGAQQLFSQQGWQQASLLFSRSKRLGRQLFGAHASVQPQAGSQALGASQHLGASQQPGAPNRLARALLVAATTLKAKRATADNRKRRFMGVTPCDKDPMGKSR